MTNKKWKKPNFSDYIIIEEENVIDFLENNYCVFCDKKVSLKDLAGFEHDYNNPFKISNPFCSNCKVKNEFTISNNEHSYSLLDRYIKKEDFSKRGI